MTNDNDQIAAELAAARTAHMAGDLAAALPVYERFAGENDPDALNLLGIVAGQQGDMTLAETRFRAALAARPSHRGAGINLAKLLGSQARSVEAVAIWARLAADHATEHPLDRAMWLEYARHLGYCHRHDDAHGILARLHEEEPGDPVVAEALLMASRYIADWSRHDRLTALVAAETAKRLAPGQTRDQTGEQVPLETPMVALFRTDDGKTQRRIAEAHAAGIAAKAEKLPPRPVRQDGGPIRLGLFTPNFHDFAPTVQLLRGVLKHLDRQKFTPILYYWGGRPLPVDHADMVAAAVDLEAMNVMQSADRVAADDIDILLDLKGWSGGHRQAALARRPARVQVSWLAYPGTVGGDWIDYALLDRHVLPDSARDEYREAVIRLPVTYQARDNAQPIGPRVSRETSGLHDDRFVFTSFNISHKLEPGIFGAWMRILSQLPDAVLWLMTAYPAYEANIRAEAAKRGIDPARILFAPHLTDKSAHLARLGAADLALDTRICGGHTTTSDALWAGVPVLGLSGNAMAARVSASLLHAVNQPDMICDSLATYEAQAIALAGEGRDRLEAHRQSLQAASSLPLFDTAARTRDLERALEMVWARHCQGLPVSDFDVPPG